MRERLRPYQSQTLDRTALAASLRSLRDSANGSVHETATEPASNSAEPVYVTPYGSQTFAEFFERTRPIVAHTLRHRHQLNNEFDIDDCLQVGYLKLWQQLQGDPNILADKPKSYVIRAICFASKAQRTAHNRHYNKVVDYDDNRRYRAPRRQDIETRIDLQTAIGQVAQTAMEQPMLLLGLYYATTQVTAKAAGIIYNCAAKTVYKQGRRAKDELIARLPGYGPHHAKE